MSCNRDVPGDYELSAVIEAAETDWNHVVEGESGITIGGPNLVFMASRLHPGSDRVSVWELFGTTPADCQAFIDRLEAMQTTDDADRQKGDMT